MKHRIHLPSSVSKRQLMDAGLAHGGSGNVTGIKGISTLKIYVTPNGNIQGLVLSDEGMEILRRSGIQYTIA